MSTNTGYSNSGNRNSGDYNSGDYNSGDWNSGDYNSGYRNSGDYNSGDYNSGDYNSGDYNSGIFNTNEPKVRMFNKLTNYTYSEFIDKFGMKYPDLHICQWIYKENMTDEEKSKIDGWETMGGYLKTLDYKEAWAEYWSRASEEDKNWFLNLPNFDADIFKEITGIDVSKPEKMIELSNGKKVSENTVLEALRALTDE
jgi:hypothetical protein